MTETYTIKMDAQVLARSKLDGHARITSALQHAGIVLGLALKVVMKLALDA